MSQKIITVVEGVIAPDQEANLVKTYNSLTDLPPGLLESFLLQNNAEKNIWQIVSIWESLEALQKMRDSTEKPAAIWVFEQAHAQPKLQIFKVNLEKI